MRSFSFYDNHENTISHSKNNNGTLKKNGILKKNSLESFSITYTRTTIISLLRFHMFNPFYSTYFRQYEFSHGLNEGHPF